MVPTHGPRGQQGGVGWAEKLMASTAHANQKVPTCPNPGGDAPGRRPKGIWGPNTWAAIEDGLPKFCVHGPLHSGCMGPCILMGPFEWA